ncbi:hypothetical protein SO802_024677 [Lithocarpus litseifolius]|uniref:Transmembrane protein n=1 Tax=Lithocarpus litseifolius TaxID=425828 RepID=A0AAW2C9R4_9ROSI
MASKKYITLVVLFILMLLFASSNVESTGVAESSKLGSKSGKLVRRLIYWNPGYPPHDSPWNHNCCTSTKADP